MSGKNWTRTFCPECGPNVAVDEEGLCASCGATAVGDGVEELAKQPSFPPFNRLSPAEAERLALLMEEMGEAHQVIGKILRRGYESRHPDGGPTNREMLEKELGDVWAAFDLMVTWMDTNRGTVHGHMETKLRNVMQYLHHQVPA